MASAETAIDALPPTLTRLPSPRLAKSRFSGKSCCKELSKPICSFRAGLARPDRRRGDRVAARPRGHGRAHGLGQGRLEHLRHVIQRAAGIARALLQHGLELVAVGQQLIEALIENRKLGVQEGVPAQRRQVAGGAAQCGHDILRLERAQVLEIVEVPFVGHRQRAGIGAVRPGDVDGRVAAGQAGSVELGADRQMQIGRGIDGKGLDQAAGRTGLGQRAEGLGQFAERDLPVGIGDQVRVLEHELHGDKARAAALLDGHLCHAEHRLGCKIAGGKLAFAVNVGLCVPFATRKKWSARVSS